MTRVIWNLRSKIKKSWMRNVYLLQWPHFVKRDTNVTELHQRNLTEPSGSQGYLSRDVRKPDFCICKNKDADQLRGNREADQRFVFATWIVHSLSF